MVVIQFGRVEDGRLLLEHAVDLPDGTPVRVSIEAISPDEEKAPSDSDIDFAEEPFFGIWADREDMQDSVAWVNRQRVSWRRPTSPAD